MLYALKKFYMQKFVFHTLFSVHRIIFYQHSEFIEQKNTVLHTCSKSQKCVLKVKNMF